MVRVIGRHAEIKRLLGHEAVGIGRDHLAAGSRVFQEKERKRVGHRLGIQLERGWPFRTGGIDDSAFGHMHRQERRGARVERQETVVHLVHEFTRAINRTVAAIDDEKAAKPERLARGDPQPGNQFDHVVVAERVLRSGLPILPPTLIHLWIPREEIPNQARRPLTGWLAPGRLGPLFLQMPVEAEDERQTRTVHGLRGACQRPAAGLPHVDGPVWVIRRQKILPRPRRAIRGCDRVYRQARVARATPGGIEVVEDDVITDAEVVHEPRQFDDPVAHVADLAVIEHRRAMDRAHLRHEPPVERSDRAALGIRLERQKRTIQALHGGLTGDVGPGVVDEEQRSKRRTLDPLLHLARQFLRLEQRSHAVVLRAHGHELPDLVIPGRTLAARISP